MEKEHIIQHILVIITSLWSTSFHLRIGKYEILTVSYYWEIWVRNNTLAARSPTEKAPSFAPNALMVPCDKI